MKLNRLFGDLERRNVICRRDSVEWKQAFHYSQGKIQNLAVFLYGTMGRRWLSAFLLLYLFHKVTQGFNYKCEMLEEPTCLGTKLMYNFTTLELVTDSPTQQAAKEKLGEWKGLKFLSKCWTVLQPLLCQVYKPRCQNSSVKLPCREQCHATRKPCEVVERYHKKWPDFLQCDRFPPGNCDGGSVSNHLKCKIFKPLKS